MERSRAPPTGSFPEKNLFEKKTSLNFHSKASEPNPRAEYTFWKKILLDIHYSLGPGRGRGVIIYILKQILKVRKRRDQFVYMIKLIINSEG